MLNTAATITTVSRCVTAALHPGGGREPWILAARHYVVPRHIVAKQVAMSHAIWMFQPGKAGQPHNDSTMRAIHASAVAKFKNAWDLLQSPATEIPFEPTPSFIAAASRGCPDDAWLAQYAKTHPFYASLDLTADWQQLHAAISESAA